MKYYLDTNIFIYLQDSQSPYHESCMQFVENVSQDYNHLLITSVETFQEIIHLFTVMKQRQVGLRKAEQAREIVDVILPVTEGDISTYFTMVQKYEKIPSRDLLHAAVCMNNDVRKLVTYDKDFNKMEEIDNMKAM